MRIYSLPSEVFELPRPAVNIVDPYSGILLEVLSPSLLTILSRLVFFDSHSV